MTEEEDVEVTEEVIERPTPIMQSEENNSSDGDKISNQAEEKPEEEETVSLNIADTPSNIVFSDIDKQMGSDGVETEVQAPKTIDRLEQIAKEAHERRKAEEEEDDEDDDMPISIGEEVRLELADVNDLNRIVNVQPPPALEVETL